MSDRSKKVVFTRVLAGLLLALLVNANAHVFAHIGAALQLRPTVGISDDSGASSPLSSFDKNQCVGCQSLRHLRLSAAGAFAQISAHDNVAISRR